MILTRLRQFAARRPNRALAALRAQVAPIRAAAAALDSLSDPALTAHFAALRSNAVHFGLSGATTARIAAAVCQAARRALEQSLFDEQLIGALAMHRGLIVEMKTGEGKTLAATLPACLDALCGEGVHIVTANDYLAARDAAWMGPLYRLLGLSVGLVTSDLDDDERRRAYACDITYGTANEFGLDYLRDHLKYTAAEQVQRGHAFAIVDEADCVLIDDARTPLTLYGESADHSQFYRTIDTLVRSLTTSCYETEPRKHRVTLTERGIEACETALRAQGLLAAPSLFDIENVALLHHLNEALRAHAVLARDIDYVVHDGEVVLVDGTSGRMLAGRRYADGLHQALEAKEGLAIQPESRTLAAITLQNYFRLYRKIAGMTGTAISERGEFQHVYGRDVIIVPTHRPIIRRDEPDVIYPSERDKLSAVIAAIEQAQTRRQPVLVGTPSVEKSEQLAALLIERGWQPRHFADDADAIDEDAIPRFAVLNARHHAIEAKIVAQAGLPGRVTIVTAMAGRGTDIRLGNGDEASARIVREAGGLLVLGTERHACKRLDDQLRGRAGRQGDPGRSLFFASLDDPLLRPLAETLRRSLRLVSPGQAIGSVRLRKALDQAQWRSSARDFEERKSLAEFDDVVDAQRCAIYHRRNELLQSGDSRILAQQILHNVIDEMLARSMHDGRTTTPPQLAELDRSIRSVLTLAVPLRDAGGGVLPGSTLRERIWSYADDWLARKFSLLGSDTMDTVSRRVCLALLDQHWAEQIARLDHLRRVVGDRRLNRTALLPEFKIEAFEAFATMMKDFEREAAAYLMRVGHTDAVVAPPMKTLAGG